MEWDGYHAMVGMKPNTSVAKLCVEHTGNFNAALDLGCGNLRDSLHLKKSGFKRIVAVDTEEPPQKFDGIEFHKSRIEDYMPMPYTFDVAFSCNTFFYVGKETALVSLTRIYNGLVSGGVFFANFSGDRDQWAVEGRYGFVGYSEDDMRRLLFNFDAKYSREQGERPAANGTKKFSDVWMVRFTKEKN